MTTTIDESTISPSEGMASKRLGLAIFKAGEIESASVDNRRDEESGEVQRLDQTILKLLSEIVVGVPTLKEVQALRVWLYKPENRSVQLHLLMADLPTKLRVGMELPLDDSIADWVWQHQRPLLIAAEAESRFPDFARLLLEWGIKYFCAVPLMLANRRIGVLGLASTSWEALHGFDLEFVQRGVSNLAIATQNIRTFRPLPKTCGNSSGATTALDGEMSSRDSFQGIIGQSAAVNTLREQIKIVAPADSTVLILGETGTGKELIARAIHNLGSRRDRPFIKVNCAAIPAGLIESELFGHERGAFTGAVCQRIGRFEMADGGTLFLDEIGDIPLELQPKLLRVLQEQEFERVGSTHTTHVNVRIVAATSRDLPGMVAAREFRPDLYYRLNVFPITVPALRERSEDIPLLVRHFVELYSGRTTKRITEISVETIDVLSRYSWPGNVRELQNVIERSVILSPGKVLQPSLDELQRSIELNASACANKINDRATLKDVEREHIIQALAATNWVLGGPKGAGARLGLARTTLIAKMQKLGISRAQP